MNQDEETTIPHVTRHDGTKTAIFVGIGVVVASLLLIGTLWLLLAG
jgi:hypothetical protein